MVLGKSLWPCLYVSFLIREVMTVWSDPYVLWAANEGWLWSVKCSTNAGFHRFPTTIHTWTCQLVNESKFLDYRSWDILSSTAPTPTRSLTFQMNEINTHLKKNLVCLVLACSLDGRALPLSWGKTWPHSGRPCFDDECAEQCNPVLLREGHLQTPFSRVIMIFNRRN